MQTGMLHTHTLMVVLFLLIYLIKCVLIWISPTTLTKFTAKTRILEMIVSSLFLITGLYLAYNNANIGAGSWFWVKLGAVFLAIPVAVVGYRRNNKFLATLSLFLILYSYGVSETKSPRMNKRDFAEANYQQALQTNPELAQVVTEPLDKSGKENPKKYDPVAHGRLVFLAQCAQCHGDDGKKGLGGAKNLNESRLDKNQIMELLKKGKNRMPSMNYLNEEEMMAVMAYVKIQFGPKGH
ncbi:MAG: c-type cytochrome [Bacteroidota bacterium]